MADRTFRLPDGTTTTHPDAYLVAWRDLARPVVAALGGRLHSFDPGVAIAVDYLAGGRVISLDTETVRRLGAAMEVSRGD